MWFISFTHITFESHRKWQPRRMVVTKRDLYLGLEGEEKVRDHIPLHEVKGILLKEAKEGNGSEEAIKTHHDFEMSVGPKSAQSRIRKVQTVSAYRFFNGFQIETIAEGFNSGRSYHIQAVTKEECNIVATTLRQLAAKARQASITANRFERSQAVVLRAYNSLPFQTFSALLILAVGNKFTEMLKTMVK
jgi:hypothetical protein